MSRKSAKSATLVQLLVYYDGPQLALFKTDQGFYMLALAVESDKCDDLFFASEITDKLFRGYMNGKYDLKYVFRYATGRHLYVFNWNNIDVNGIVRLKKASLEQISTNKFYPDRGFFADDHSEKWLQQPAPSSKKRIEIDGRWEAVDFSKFYTKLGDVYAFLTIIEDLGSDAISDNEKSEISEAINRPAWKGGGSFVAFYSDIASHAQSIRPLRIAGVQYNSPGHIDVEGRQTVFEKIDATVNAFEKNDDEIKMIYSNLYKLLKSEDMLGNDKHTQFSSDYNRDYAVELANKLAKSLGAVDYDRILIVADENASIYAKIVASYYRRVKDLYKFQKQGRVVLAQPTSPLAI